MMLPRICLLTIVTVLSIGCGDSETATNTEPGTTNGPGTNSDSNTANRISQLSTKPKVVALPEDLPDDIPIYPGSELVYVGSSEGGFRQSAGTLIHLQTTDSVEQVHKFYLQKMKEANWEFIVENLPGPAAKKDDRHLTLTIIELPEKPGTVLIRLIYSRPEDAKE